MIQRRMAGLAWIQVLTLLSVTVHKSQSKTTLLSAYRTTSAKGLIGVSASWKGSVQGVTVGSCEFPQEWQGGKQWWRGYVSGNATLSAEALNYGYEMFNSGSISSFEKRSAHETKRQATTVEQCASRLGAMTSYEVLPLFNPQTAEVSVRDCPLPAGVYSTEIVEQTESGSHTYCQGRPDSSTSISKSKMDVHSCRRVDTFEKPYYSYLYCVSSWSGNVLGGNFGSVAAADKSLLLLYQNKNSNVRPHFYIGRYRTSGNGVVLLSLYVGDTKKITGVLTATADKRSTAYRNFIFKRTGDVPTDPNGNSPSGAPPVEGQQTNCVGGCLNGICQQNSGIWQCVCKAGYSGTSCERVLTVGQCAKDLCKKGVCDQHDAYYYCRCAEGYTGLNCDVSQYCLPNPCVRGACQLFQGGYRCLCPEGYSGRACALNAIAEVEEDQKVLIVLTTLLSVFVVGIVVVAIVICQCKRKREEKSLPVNPDGDLPNQTYSSMTSWFPDYKRELAVSEETAGP